MVWPTLGSRTAKEQKQEPAFGAPTGGDPGRISRSLASETRVPRLSCGVVCVILRLAVLAELRLVTDTDRQTDTGS